MGNGDPIMWDGGAGRAGCALWPLGRPLGHEQRCGDLVAGTHCMRPVATPVTARCAFLCPRAAMSGRGRREGEELVRMFSDLPDDNGGVCEAGAIEVGGRVHVYGIGVSGEDCGRLMWGPCAPQGSELPAVSVGLLGCSDIGGVGLAKAEQHEHLCPWPPPLPVQRGPQ